VELERKGVTDINGIEISTCMLHVKQFNITLKFKIQSDSCTKCRTFFQNISKNRSTKINIFGLNFKPNISSFFTHFCLYFGTK
jgi:hypothetical protein